MNLNIIILNILAVWSLSGIILFTLFALCSEFINDLEHGYINKAQFAYIIILFGPLVWTITLFAFTVQLIIKFYDYLGENIDK